MIDLHCHVLAGIDDGPATIEDSLALARAAAAAGTRTIVATPHVSWHYQNTAEGVGRAVTELNRRLVAEGLDLEVLAGAEIAVTRIFDIPPEELSQLTLAGGGWLLVEPPFTPAATGLESMLLELRRRGHPIVLAHPERCPTFHRNPEMLETVLRAGALASITAGSLVGQFGERPRRFALDLLQRGMAHNVASDAHDVVVRAPSMAEEIERAGLGPLSDWLTCAVPAAIVEGRETIPPRPEVELASSAPPRSRWRRRR